MTDPALLAALAQALERDPRNGPLWMHYAELLVLAQRPDEAASALRNAAEIANTRKAAIKKLVPLLREQGKLAEALIRAEALLEAEPDDELAQEVLRIQALRGGVVEKAQEREAAPTPPAERGRAEARSSEPRPGSSRTKEDAAAAEVAPKPLDDEAWAAQFDWGDLRVTFADVAGLDDVKRQIHLRIIAPFKQPEVYEAFGRKGGGGILLYGPPGCGKTYIARATAGELGARFVSVSIHDVMDKYWGESEKLVHGLFEHARRSAPTVLFFDEFDALGSTRGREQSQFWKTLVDQLLQEMDGVKARNRDVLLLAATNVPWNVDSAFRRPGRFDRVLFVTPPDKAARQSMLEDRLRSLPGGEKLDVRGAVEKTDLYSGADLVARSERAAERALERSLESGSVHRVDPKDLEAALAQSRASTLEWLSTARNYARYSNDGGQYDELVEFLKRVRKW
ncbi:MAG: AAA family ATPase [Planctomycetes bacterium]|nr:AAA family ATPase [Planctomycetota bacterium]